MTVALTFLQRLEFPIELPVTSESETYQAEALEEETFIRNCKNHYAQDCEVMYQARLKAAAAQGISPSLVPRLLVPPSLDPDDKQYQTEIEVQVKNEEGHLNGRFGWCVVSRKPANYYCKESRLPVHDLECKLKYLEIEGHAQRRNLEIKLLGDAKKKQLVTDSLMMFKTFMQYAFNETK